MADLNYTVRKIDKLLRFDTTHGNVVATLLPFKDTPNAPYEVHKISSGDGNTVTIKVDPTTSDFLLPDHSTSIVLDDDHNSALIKIPADAASPAFVNTGGGAAGPPISSQVYWRVFDCHDTRPRTNAGPHLNVQETGMGISITGILRKAITADLVMKVWVGAAGGSPALLGTFTIPSSTPVDHEVSVPITTRTFVKSQSITFDIMASDSSKDVDGIAVITVKWGVATQVSIASTNQGPYDPAATYAKGITVQDGGQTYLSLTDGNSGNALTDTTHWTIAAAKGDGTSWHTGSGAPSGGTGVVGDLYLDTATGNYYEKTGTSTWTLRGNLMGPTGATGAAGAAGAAGSKWYDGSGVPSSGTGVVGDFYLNTANGDYYEKTGTSTWTLRGNLTGPTGPTGPAGAAGTGTAAYISALIAGPDTTKTIAGATHGYATAGLLVAIYDNAAPRNAIEASWTVNASTFDVVVTFGTPQSNYYVVINGATGMQGPAGAPGTGSGTVTNTVGPLTANLPVLGNSGADVKIGIAAQLVPTLPADATKYLDGTGAFSVPAGTGGGSIYAGLSQATAANGHNTVTLGSTPLAGSVGLFLNGVLIPPSLVSVSGSVASYSGTWTAGDIISARWLTANSTPGGITLSSTAVTIRGARSHAATTDPAFLTWPSGSLAGDLAVILLGSTAGSQITPSGWTSLYTQSGSFFTGAVFSKVLTSGDITAGGISLGTNGGLSSASVVVMIGAPAIANTVGSIWGGANPLTSGAASSGQTALYLGACNATGSNTVTRGTLAASDSGSNTSGMVYTEVLGSSGAVTATFNYATSQSTQAIVILATTTGAAGTLPEVQQSQIIGLSSALPLTTKGDLYGYSTASPARIPVGSDGQVLVADSTQTLGVKWTAPTGGGGGGGGSAMTQNVVTGSRVLGTVYQNTSGSPMYVEVSARTAGSTSASIVALTDTSNPPTTQVAFQFLPTAGNSQAVMFIVLPGSYYKVFVNLGTPTVDIWAEWTGGGGSGSGGGALVLLEQHTASNSASLDFTSWYSSAYDQYEICFVGIYASGSSGGVLQLLFSTSGGSSYDTGSNYGFTSWLWGDGTVQDHSNATTAIRFDGTLGDLAPDASSGYCGVLVLSVPPGGYNSLIGNLSSGRVADGASPRHAIGMTITGHYMNATGVNALRFKFTSPNIAAGTIRVYGVAKTTVTPPDSILVNGA